jgi:protein phosphatase 1 regulatory subunit 37
LRGVSTLWGVETMYLMLTSLQTGITYIAQVLKRNRTLKVLNLAENKLDVACLVSLAEALVRVSPSTVSSPILMMPHTEIQFKP